MNCCHITGLGKCLRVEDAEMKPGTMNVVRNRRAWWSQWLSELGKFASLSRLPNDAPVLSNGDASVDILPLCISTPLP
jgi:hypothetical protein